MIRHIVFWKFHPEAEGRSASENAALLKEKLLALKGEIPELLEASCGVDFNKSPAAFEFALDTVFATKEDLQIYQDHPKHVLVKEFVGKITSSRAVVDYEF
ncbi:MAG: Dabb family protein [Opitutales bacterium]|nr:Dabb family protein [Opitutales bacterium]